MPTFPPAQDPATPSSPCVDPKMLPAALGAHEAAFEKLYGSRDMAKAKAELERLAERLGWDYDLTYLADLEVPNG